MPRDVVKETDAVLAEHWTEIRQLGEAGTIKDWVDDPTLVESIRSAINSSAKTYRYVLPTQIAAKQADAHVDCRCIQVARGGEGAFDARTIAHKVIVPFDQANENVLGGSIEPYVSNPLRVPEISESYRAAQKNKKDWDHLVQVLDAVEKTNSPKFTERVFKQILTEIYHRLSDVRVVYPAPLRVSLESNLALVESFLSEHSGGDRLLALTSALFVIMGKRFHLYSDVRRANITAADVATGMLADLECVSTDGDIVMIVEVKDRALTVSQVKSKIPDIRGKQVSEILFVAQQGISNTDETAISKLVAKEFVSGHNVYIVTFTELCKVAFALLGEDGRRDFLHEVGSQLDKYRSDINHRRCWAKLLGQL